MTIKISTFSKLYSIQSLVRVRCVSFLLLHIEIAQEARQISCRNPRVLINTHLLRFFNIMGHLTKLGHSIAWFLYAILTLCTHVHLSCAFVFISLVALHIILLGEGCDVFIVL